MIGRNGRNAIIDSLDTENIENDHTSYGSPPFSENTVSDFYYNVKPLKCHFRYPCLTAPTNQPALIEVVFFQEFLRVAIFFLGGKFWVDDFARDRGGDRCFRLGG